MTKAEEFLIRIKGFGLKPIGFRECYGDGDIMVVSGSTHGFACSKVILLSMPAAFEYTPAGTNDGLRDGESSSQYSKAGRLYFSLADLKAIDGGIELLREFGEQA